MMKKKFTKYFLTIFFFILVIVPVSGLAQTDGNTSSGLVPCGTESYKKGEVVNGENVEYLIKNPCTFSSIFVLINNVINFLLFVIALPVAAIMLAYAGFLFMFSGMQPEARSKAKRIFGKVVFGFVLAAAAWLIVHLVLSVLGYNGSWIGL